MLFIDCTSFETFLSFFIITASLENQQAIKCRLQVHEGIFRTDGSLRSWWNNKIVSIARLFERFFQQSHDESLLNSSIWIIIQLILKWSSVVSFTQWLSLALFQQLNVSVLWLFKASMRKVVQSLWLFNFYAMFMHAHTKTNTLTPSTSSVFVPFLHVSAVQ